MKDGNLWPVSFPKAGEPGKGKDEGRSLDKPSKTGRSPAGGGSKAKQVCSRLAVMPPSPVGGCDPLGTRSHQKLRTFVAKLTVAKQMNPSFRPGYPQARVGKRTHRNGQAASDRSDDEGPLKHASTELRSMRSAPPQGRGSGGGGGSRGQCPWWFPPAQFHSPNQGT